MSLFSKKVAAEIDHLEHGTAIGAYAVQTFNTIHDDLLLANSHLKTAKDEAEAKIAAETARVKTAVEQASANSHIISQIEQFLGIGA